MGGPTDMPSVTNVNRQYQEFLSQGRFCVQRCGACHAWIFYPRVICTSCGSDDLSFEDADRKGTVYSCATVHQPNALGKNYNISIVELDIGCRLMSRVENIAPEKVEIGMPVSAVVISENGRPLLVFEPSHAVI